MATIAAVAAAFLLPGFAPVPHQPQAGTLYAGRFPGTMRTGYVYLPAAFTTARRYPVVYLLHGMPGDPSEYVHGAGLTEFAASGRARPFIAVMPGAGTRTRYNGEWAGRWETALVARIVPWVDAHLPTIASAGGRVLAGLSAGGYGAADIALRNPGLFGTVESWSGYFEPLHDGPLAHADQELLDENDPFLLARAAARELRADGTRFFLSTGPAHSHWFRPEQTIAFARELRRDGVRVALRVYPRRRGEYTAQLADGLAWALPPTATE